MSYDLRAVIAPEAVFRPIPIWVAGSTVVPLPQGLALIPCTTGLVHQFGPADRPWLYQPSPPFLWLPAALVPHLRALSMTGPVAYVEAEYDGAGGTQRSAVWRYRRFKQPPLRTRSALNEALSVLGVERGAFTDAFDALGLGRHRETDAWVTPVTGGTT